MFAPDARATTIAACVAMRNRSGIAGPRSGRAENQCVASSPAAACSSTPLSPPPGGRSDQEAAGTPVISWTCRTTIRPGSSACRCSRSSWTRRPAPVLPPVVVEKKLLASGLSKSAGVVSSVRLPRTIGFVPLNSSKLTYTPDCRSCSSAPVEPLARQQLVYVVRGAARVIEQRAIGAARIAEDPPLEHREEVALAVVQALLHDRHRFGHAHAPANEPRQPAEEAREGEELRGYVITRCGHGVRRRSERANPYWP